MLELTRSVTMTAAADPLLALAGAHPTISRNGTVASIGLNGQLDANSGVELLAAVHAELEGASRIDVDLTGLSGWTPEGARSLRRARSLSGRLVDGLHFRTTSGAGRDALLEAFIDGDDAE